MYVSLSFQLLIYVYNSIKKRCLINVSIKGSNKRFSNCHKYTVFVWFLAHLRWKLKCTFLIVCCPCVGLSVNSSPREDNNQIAQVYFSDRLLSVRRSVCKLFTFSSSPREDNNQIAKISSRTAGPISTKLGSKHPLVNWFQFSTDKYHLNLKTKGDIVIRVWSYTYQMCSLVGIVSQVSNVTHGLLFYWRYRHRPLKSYQ